MRPRVRAKRAPTVGSEARAWWPAVGDPLERWVGQHSVLRKRVLEFIAVFASCEDDVELPNQTNKLASSGVGNYGD